jgi:hypothetical protein
MAEFTPATGFWSYAHIDNDAMQGHALELADGVAKIYRMKTCETIKIFVDRKDIQWSQNWRALISNSILGTTFFFAITSPNYLKSPNCRDEFDEFWKAAKNSRAPKLLMPILYEGVDIDNSTDPICEIAREIQYVDWRTTKLEDKTSSLYRKKLDQMGKDLVAAAIQAANAPEPEPEPEVAMPQTPEKPEEGDGDDQGGVEGAPPEPGPTDTLPTGLLEDLVRAQALQVELKNHVEKAKAALDEVVAEITRTPVPPNASAGQRLFYVNAISTHIREPAERFEAEAKILEQNTRELTDIVFRVADAMANPVFAASVKQADIEKLLQMREQIVQEFKDLEQARAIVNAIGRMSRKMKYSISAVERGFDSLGAMREMFLSWVSAFEPVIAGVVERPSSADRSQLDSPPLPPAQQ